MNSLVIVLFLSGMVAMIMLRTLHKDIARYNQVDQVRRLLVMLLIINLKCINFIINSNLIILEFSPGHDRFGKFSKKLTVV